MSKYFYVIVIIFFNLISIYTEIPNGYVFVKSGTFQMGSKSGDYDEIPEHEVTLDNFIIGKYEVTFKDFIIFLNSENNGIVNQNFVVNINKVISNIGYNKKFFFFPTNFAKTDMSPVVLVSWFAAIEYCNWLSIQNGLDPAYFIDGKKIILNPNSFGFRLPTEAEWEYAAKGGNESKGFIFSGSNRIESVAWYGDNLYESIMQVGSYNPNEIGIYDMSGNVWEWCWDNYAENSYKKDLSTTGPLKVLRGGSWGLNKYMSRVTNRHSINPNSKNKFTGFRIVRRI